MRIISGKFRSRVLRVPAGLTARPTTDRAKEGLFNWLNARIDFENIAVMDLFSGTGNISFESISRGATKVVAVDKNQASVQYIREQFGQMGTGDFQVFCTDSRVALERSKDTFDLIFADPPYDYKEHREFVNLVMQSGLLKDGAWFILEHPVEVKVADLDGFQETRHYGRVYFSFFNLEDQNA